MTWSSNRSPGRAGLTEADVASETELSVWTELKGPAELEAQARQEAAEQESAQREARHREEVEDAYRRGMTEGRQAGEQRAHLELAAATQAAEAALAGLIEAEKSYQRELTESLTALAVVIARKIVERELTTDPDTVTTLVHTVVAQFPMDQSVKIRLNPDDLAHIVESAEAGVEGSEFAAIREIRWVPDDSVVHGGCVVEGPDRVVDGRVDRALERLFWAVKDA